MKNLIIKCIRSAIIDRQEFLYAFRAIELIEFLLHKTAFVEHNCQQQEKPKQILQQARKKWFCFMTQFT